MTVTDKEQLRSPDIEAYQAMKLLEMGDKNGAIKKCIDAISRYGSNRNCYLVKARAHIEQEEYGFAETALQSVLQLDPEHPAAWAMMGEVYFRLGKDAKVEYCRERLESIFPSLTEGADLDDIESVTSEDTSAIQTGEKLTDESSQSIVPLEDLDYEIGEQSQTNESLNDVTSDSSSGQKSSPDQNPNTAETKGVFKSELFETATFADICVNQGKYEKALKIYKRLLNNDPDNAKYIDKVKMIKRRWEDNDSE
ncbi:MAG: tetratricopeptide repeat protein [candidate division Zixibacteria bacterium]|nr:tetratricopeptide repeat protein [candidate division Zixibacteria bacterium]